MRRKSRRIDNPQLIHALQPQTIIRRLAQRTRAHNMILRTNMILDILDPFFFGRQIFASGQ